MLWSTVNWLLHVIERAHHVESRLFSMQVIKADEHAECLAAQASAAQHSFVHSVCFATLSSSQVKTSSRPAVVFETAIRSLCLTNTGSAVGASSGANAAVPGCCCVGCGVTTVVMFPAVPWSKSAAGLPLLRPRPQPEAQCSTSQQQHNDGEHHPGKRAAVAALAAAGGCARLH